MCGKLGWASERRLRVRARVAAAARLVRGGVARRRLPQQRTMRTALRRTVFALLVRRWTGCSATGAATSGSTCTAWGCPAPRCARTTTTSAAPARTSAASAPGTTHPHSGALHLPSTSDTVCSVFLSSVLPLYELVQF